jgi:putative ABC transport system permease protein
MTATVEHAEPRSPFVDPPRPSRLSRWLGGWRVALRLARRDAWHGKGRALLVLLLIALPVGGVTASVTVGLAGQRLHGGTASGLRSLGTVAEARLVFGSGGEVRQSPDASTWSDSGDGSVPTDPGRVLATLPPGSRVVSGGGIANAVIEQDVWGVVGAVLVADLRDPLVAGRWYVRAGRLPAGPGEVALVTASARRLSATLGSTVTMTTTTAARGAARTTVVGLVDPVEPFTSVADAVVTTGVLPVDPALGTGDGVPKTGPGAGEWLVATPRPLDWSDVRRLNALGAVVTSRGVLTAPPSFCPIDHICLDNGPDPSDEQGVVTQTPAQLADLAREAALTVVIVVLIVLQVALLAGPAFAVQLRRRQRELGLVGASGGTAADLRRTVLASGVVLGVAGAALGLAVGWLIVLLLGGLLPWAPLADFGVPLGVPPFHPAVVLVAGIGVLAAFVAALVPAVIAGRGDVVDALRGRRPLPALRTTTPVIGLVLGAVGVGLLLYGVPHTDSLVLGLGIVAAELGLVLVMPWLVVQCGRVGRALPLAPRLAVRDAGRHRLRTSAAAVAIAAAAASAVAASTWSASNEGRLSYSDRAVVSGTVVVWIGADPTASGPALAEVTGYTAAVRRVVDQVAPGSPTATLVQVTAAAALAHRDGLGVDCVSPYVGATPTFTTDQAQWGPCWGRQADSSLTGGEVELVTDPGALGVVLGPISDSELAAARATLERGGAVVLQPHTVDPSGRVWLRSTTINPADGAPTDSAPFAVPATELLHGALPASVLLGPAALAPGAAAAALAPAPWNQVTLVTPSEADRPDRPTVADQLAIALQKDRVPASAYAPADPTFDNVTTALAAAGGATLLLALLAGLMVTALAMADARGDLVTLASVGAPPRVRRAMAASSAGFVALLGCATGAVSGLVIARVLLPLFSSGGDGQLVIRWPIVAFIVVAIPLITAGAAWLTTRSRIVLTRRTD